jgi:hypothetical protein
VLSATLHLPVGVLPAAAADAKEIQRQLRELTYHPEQYLQNTDGTTGELPRDVTQCIEEKRRWLNTPQTPQTARTRHQAIEHANAALQPWVATRRATLQTAQAELARALHAQRVLQWREYAFCLYPEKTLREFLAGLLPNFA